MPCSTRRRAQEAREQSGAHGQAGDGAAEMRAEVDVAFVLREHGHERGHEHTEQLELRGKPRSAGQGLCHEEAGAEQRHGRARGTNRDGVPIVRGERYQGATDAAEQIDGRKPAPAEAAFDEEAGHHDRHRIADQMHGIRVQESAADQPEPLARVRGGDVEATEPEQRVDRRRQLDAWAHHGDLLDGETEHEHGHDDPGGAHLRVRERLSFGLDGGHDRAATDLERLAEGARHSTVGYMQVEQLAPGGYFEAPVALPGHEAGIDRAIEAVCSWFELDLADETLPHRAGADLGAVDRKSNASVRGHEPRGAKVHADQHGRRC